MRRIVIGSALLVLLSTAPAEAQLFNNPARTYGIGSTTGKGPRFQGFGAGVLPLNYRGAPGESEGTFSPPDHRVFNVAPNFGMGLGWFGKRSPSPRPEPNFSYNPPVQLNTSEPPLFGTPEASPTPEPIAGPQTSIVVEVRVPVEDAQVFANNTATRQTGLVRIFASPELPAGEKYQYEIRVEWTANGQKQVAKQTVIGKAGDRLLADFAK